MPKTLEEALLEIEELTEENERLTEELEAIRGAISKFQDGLAEIGEIELEDSGDEDEA